MGPPQVLSHEVSDWRRVRVIFSEPPLARRVVYFYLVVYQV